jgi:hypothetical protein
MAVLEDALTPGKLAPISAEMMRTLALVSPPEDTGICLKIWLLCGRQHRRCHSKVAALLHRHEELCRRNPTPTQFPHLPKKPHIQHFKNELEAVLETLEKVQK